MTTKVNGVTFIHDHKFRYIDGKFYSTGGLSDDALERYIRAFGSVKVIARIINEDETSKGYSEITSKNVEIIDGSILTNEEFKKIVRKSNYVICRLPSFLGYKGAFYAKRFDIPYLTEVVGCAWDALWNHSLKGKVIALPTFLFMKQIVKNSKYSIYVTKYFLQNRYPTNGRSTNCSNVSLKEIRDDVLTRRLLKIKEQNDRIIIGTTAAIDVKYKGQQYVIMAIGKLKEIGIHNIYYELVGGGSSEYLKQVAIKYNVEENVKFLGVKPHKEIFDWLDNIDLYIQPSKQEGLPRALIEAMSRALPSLGANTAGIPELLEKQVIFSNSSQNVEEIAKMLINFDETKMMKQAKKNFDEAKQYEKTIIEERRNNFLKLFIDENN